MFRGTSCILISNFKLCSDQTKRNITHFYKYDLDIVIYCSGLLMNMLMYYVILIIVLCLYLFPHFIFCNIFVNHLQSLFFT